MPTKLPTLTWAIVATDLFHWKGSDYLLVVDMYIEIARLSTTTSGHQTTNDSLCTTRSTMQAKWFQTIHGPQYASLELARFSKTHDSPKGSPTKLAVSDTRRVMGKQKGSSGQSRVRALIRRHRDCGSYPSTDQDFCGTVAILQWS